MHEGTASIKIQVMIFPKNKMQIFMSMMEIHFQVPLYDSGAQGPLGNDYRLGCDKFDDEFDVNEDP